MQLDLSRRLGRTAAPLRVGHVARALALEVRIDYQLDRLNDGQWDVQVVGYAYQVYEPRGREILAYHWHPFGPSPVRHPHVHLSSRIPQFDLDNGITISIADSHLPTGFVTLADVVRLLITEFGVEPRRSAWEDVLGRANP